MHGEVKQYDVLIIGGGPAGTACALRLKDSGLRVALIDKKSFPRDKICGDAIPGRAIKTLRSIDASYATEFQQFGKKFTSNKTRFIYNNRLLDFNWVGEAYTCARMHFDHFLFNLVAKNTSTHIFTNAKLGEARIEEGKVYITETANNITFLASILIGADGAQSVIAKKFTGRVMDRNHHVGSVRAYYSNITGTESTTTEVYFDKESLPSYLWVFPLPGNLCNVGFGMLSATIAERKVNLRQMFHQFIAEHPALAARFKDATLVGELEGFGLPLGSRKVQLSGDNFLLVGDAGSLIDPFSGEGIGNAMLSGKLAAEQVIDSFKKNDFSAEAMQQYDEKLFQAIGKEMKFRYKAQTILARFPFILDIIFKCSRNKMLMRFLQKKM